ncbi:hypothetical protein LUZ60_002206 [Juncus effusus]|nr:hypothetical protein LUZ60_002206 [Juncus effusus]
MARSRQNPIPSANRPSMATSSQPNPSTNSNSNRPSMATSSQQNPSTNSNSNRPLMAGSQPNPSSNRPLMPSSQPNPTANKPSMAVSLPNPIPNRPSMAGSHSQPNPIPNRPSMAGSHSQPNPIPNRPSMATSQPNPSTNSNSNSNMPLMAGSQPNPSSNSNRSLTAGSQPNPFPSSNDSVSPSSLKLALAMALVRSGHRLNHPVASLSPSASSNQILHWKNKAKERKRQIARLREEIKLLQDGAGCESEPPIVSCKCHFFEGCGEAGPCVSDGTGDLHWIDEVLRRRFLRLVRWKERRKRVERSFDSRNSMEFESEDEIGRLSVSIDFLVELSDKVLAKGEVDSSFSSFSHQAIDFILASMKNILASEKQRENLEEITNGMIMRLIKRMCTNSQNYCQLDSGSLIDLNSDPQFCVQHLMRKLGQEIFVGQRLMLTISQNISILAESLLLIDPFHDNYPILDSNMFLLIQLIEFLISDYIKSWLNIEQFDKRLFEEWVRSILKARNDLRILENMNGLYIIYMDRVAGLIAKEVGPAAHEGKLDPQVFSKLLS